MLGKWPYKGKDRKEIRDKVLKEQVQIKMSEIPEGWSIEAADFINKLIQRKPANRLGLNGPEEVKQHVWFKGFDWNALLTQKVKPGFIPPPKPAVKPKVFTEEEAERYEKELNEAEELLKLEHTQTTFKEYFFDIEQIKFRKLQQMRYEAYMKKMGMVDPETEFIGS